ncbi:MAG: DUF721 domain-containing protein [Spirochaetota bacterium]|jgi:hypothetical protein|nr:DUF721 domain-containing protein [Spirochaetota bacterium]
MNNRNIRLRRKGGTENISAVLDRVLTNGNAREALKKKQLLDELTCRIGRDFARHLKAEKVFRGTLYCLVDSPSWLQQYQFYSAEILRRVNSPPLAEPITAARFSLGRINESEYLSEDDGDPVREQRALPALTPGEIAGLENTVRAVSPELQSSIRPLVDDWIRRHPPPEEEKQERS